ncbi:MAG: 3'-5' exonuclease, partial [Oscillatoria sp. PMC 1076.18]|nr:3'-5' exonuclease [Oscillatoria sp. PMC 1076.18]
KNGIFEPKKIIVQSNSEIKKIFSYLQDRIIIIACDEGAEKDYVQNDEILCRFLSDREKTEAPWNVLSAIAAKGLEFKQVILYKFGEASNEKYWTITENPGEEIRYFFNKLYVAVSRATERLFIIDTESGENNLWKRASTETELDQVLEQLSNEKEREQWRERIQLISLGNRLEELGTDDFLQANAQIFETQGLQSQNPDWLRRAQKAYLQLGNETKARKCEAWALKIDKEYLEAGTRFLELQQVEEAWDCFWEGMCWTELVNWYAEQEEKPNPQISSDQTLVRPLVNFMATSDEQSINRLENFTAFLETEINNNQLKEHRFSQQWQNAFGQYAQIISNLQSNKQLIPNEQWQTFAQVLLQLAQAGYQKDSFTTKAAKCFYQAKKYSQAVEAWEQIQATQTPEYNFAKAELLGMPAGIEYLAKIPAYPRIILLWQQAGQPKEKAWLNYVAPALEALNQYKNAFIIYTWLDIPSKVKSCWEQATGNQPEVKSLRALLHYYLGHQYWQDAIATLETYFSTLQPAEQIALKFDFVYHLAASRLTPESLNTDLRLRYEQFLKQQIINSSNWQQYLLTEHLGITLEKIGSFVETLTFYERYISHPNPDLRLFARQRWLAVKTKQKDYVRNQGQINKADNINLDITKKAQNWNIALETLSLDAPLPPKQRPNPKVSLLVKTKSRKPQVETRQIGTLLIKTLREQGLILIKDILSEEKIRISSRVRQIQIGAVTVTAKESNHLSFSVPTSGYEGVVTYNRNNVRLELEITGEENTVIVEV